MRQASSEAEQKLEDFNIESQMRVDLYEAVQEVAESSAMQTLDAAQQRLVKDMLQDFKQNGLHLSEELRHEVKELKKRCELLLFSGVGIGGEGMIAGQGHVYLHRGQKVVKGGRWVESIPLMCVAGWSSSFFVPNSISEKCIKFRQNLSEDVTCLYFNPQELEGCSESFLAGLEKNEEGKLKVTLQYPHVFGVLQHCKVEETRDTMERTFANRCKDENVPIFEQVVATRQGASRFRTVW